MHAEHDHGAPDLRAGHERDVKHVRDQRNRRYDEPRREAILVDERLQQGRRFGGRPSGRGLAIACGTVQIVGVVIARLADLPPQ